MNAAFQTMFDQLGIKRANPFASPVSAGLLGGVYTQPTHRMGDGEAKDAYAMMASPYAQFAAQQLQGVMPQQQGNIPGAQQQALAQMWEQMNRPQNYVSRNAGDNSWG